MCGGCFAQKRHAHAYKTQISKMPKTKRNFQNANDKNVILRDDFIIRLRQLHKIRRQNLKRCEMCHTSQTARKQRAYDKIGRRRYRRDTSFYDSQRKIRKPPRFRVNENKRQRPAQKGMATVESQNVLWTWSHCPPGKMSAPPAGRP